MHFFELCYIEGLTTVKTLHIQSLTQYIKLDSCNENMIKVEYKSKVKK